MQSQSDFRGGGATRNSLVTKVLTDLKNKFNRIFDKKSNSNTLHGYRNSHSEFNSESNNVNEMLKQVQHDRLLYGHSERSEESHNILCPLFLFGFDAKRKSEPKKKNTNDQMERVISGKAPEPLKKSMSLRGKIMSKQDMDQNRVTS